MKLIGQQFGYWTVIEKDKPKNWRSYYICKCKCGTVRSVSRGNIVGELSKSCGCYQKERASEYHIKDITGQKFKLLTAVKFTGKDKYGKSIWEFKCDCGNIKSIPIHQVVSGSTKSCGCLKSFKGEKNPNYVDGTGMKKYPYEFSNKLRELIRKRDQYRCQECFRHQDELYTSTGKKYKLNIHHIDFNKENNVQDNLISLCQNCHAQTFYNRNKWIIYYKNKIQGEKLCQPI